MKKNIRLGKWQHSEYTGLRNNYKKKIKLLNANRFVKWPQSAAEESYNRLNLTSLT